jgi:hypothetical protein
MSTVTQQHRSGRDEPPLGHQQRLARARGAVHQHDPLPGVAGEEVLQAGPADGEVGHDGRGPAGAAVAPGSHRLGRDPSSVRTRRGSEDRRMAEGRRQTSRRVGGTGGSHRASSSDVRAATPSAIRHAAQDRCAGLHHCTPSGPRSLTNVNALVADSPRPPRPGALLSVNGDLGRVRPWGIVRLGDMCIVFDVRRPPPGVDLSTGPRLPRGRSGGRPLHRDALLSLAPRGADRWPRPRGRSAPSTTTARRTRPGGRQPGARARDGERRPAAGVVASASPGPHQEDDDRLGVAIFYLLVTVLFAINRYDALVADGTIRTVLLQPLTLAGARRRVWACHHRTDRRGASSSWTVRDLRLVDHGDPGAGRRPRPHAARSRAALAMIGPRLGAAAAAVVPAQAGRSRGPGRVARPAPAGDGLRRPAAPAPGDRCCRRRRAAAARATGVGIRRRRGAHARSRHRWRPKGRVVGHALAGRGRRTYGVADRPDATVERLGAAMGQAVRRSHHLAERETMAATDERHRIARELHGLGHPNAVLGGDGRRPAPQVAAHDPAACRAPGRPDPLDDPRRAGRPPGAACSRCAKRSPKPGAWVRSSTSWPRRRAPRCASSST